MFVLEPEKQTQNLILIRYFYNASKLTFKFSPQLRLWIQKFETYQKMTKNLPWKAIFFSHFNARRQYFWRFFFKKHDFELNFSQCVPLWIKNSIMCQILKWKLNNVSDFEMKFSQRVRYPFWNSSCCQILNFIFRNVSHFEMKFLQRVNFSKYN